MDRLVNLKKVIDWVLGFHAVELIIVEQDRAPKLPSFSLKGFKYVFTKSDLPFNKAWAFNVALKQATTDVIVFGDCDIIMDPNEFISSLKLLEVYESVSPYSKVIDLQANEIGMTLQQMAKIERPGRGEVDIQKICLAGGIIMYRRESIYKIGGWDQSFISWGGEDDWESHKTKMLLKWIECPNKCYHLYHSKVTPNMTFYQRNLQLLNKLISLQKDEVVKYINNSASKIGFKNSYYDK